VNFKVKTKIKEDAYPIISSACSTDNEPFESNWPSFSKSLPQSKKTKDQEKFKDKALE